MLMPAVQLAKCIVVDNASSDGSIDLIRDMDLPLELILNTENKGFGFASNQGAKCGNSEYILFLNPDVQLFPDSLSNSISFMESCTDLQIGVLGIQMIDQKGAIHRNVARFPSPTSLFYQMLGIDRLMPVPHPPATHAGLDLEPAVLRGELGDHCRSGYARSAIVRQGERGPRGAGGGAPGGALGGPGARRSY